MDSKKQAQGIASLGRYGDTTLMHMRPDEVEQLTALSRANGGDITINPKTGMPEAFLGNFVSSLLPTAAGIGAGALFGPAGGAIAGGLTSYMQGKRDPLSIGLGALGGYGGANIAQNLQQTAASQIAKAPTAIQPTQVYTPIDTTIGGANLSQAGAGAGPIPTNIGANMGQVNNPFATPRVSDFDAALANRQPFSQAASNAPRPVYNVDQNLAVQPDVNIPPLQQSATTPLEKGYEFAQQKFGELGQGTKQVFTDSGAREEFFQRMGGAQFDDAGQMIKEGSPTMGMVKTALPIAGAGLEAYQKGIKYPTYEASTAGKYDPTRTLNLGMDTGLRLLAKGGAVKKYQSGGMAMYGMQPPPPPPEYGIVDVGGNFVKTSDEPGANLITKDDFYDRFKFKQEGYTPEEKEEQDGQDFDTKAGVQQPAGGGISPGVALNLAQNYAESQQSGLDEQGLGTLKTGGSVKRYQQGGQTTAEMNTAKAATPPPVTTMDMLIAKKNEEEMANQGIPAGVNIEAIKAQAANAGMASGGIAELTPEDGKMLNGEGDGVSDDIPAMIEGEQEAALSDGEFIVPARIVSELGNGSSDAGAKKLYAMIDRIQAARKQTMGNDKQYANDTDAERYLPA